MMYREHNIKTVFTIIGACIIFIAGCVFVNISLVYGFAASIILSCLILMKMGFGIKELLLIMFNGLKECRVLYLLILLIGATVSIWLSSGVVPAMIFYGFEYMKGMNFLFVSFLIISVSAIFMGTAVGTVSTIGIAVLGIGKGFGIPPMVLLGVIVSGAFIADKISPISGLLNLTLSSTETTYRDALKSMLLTLGPTLVITGIIYFLLGIRYGTGRNASEIIEFQRAIAQGFSISPLLLLMPVFIVVLSFFGLRIIYSIIFGLSGGILISIVFQRMTVLQVVESIFRGYRANTPSIGLNELLISGGVFSMFQVVLIVMGAIALSSILEGTGLIRLITGKFVSRIESKGELIVKTGIISGILTILTCDQTMGIVLPGRLLKGKYDELKLNRNVLARTISDTGTIIAPLMPWNVNSLIIGLISGISTAYAPYAILCYISPLITIIYGFLYDKIKNK